MTFKQHLTLMHYTIEYYSSRMVPTLEKIESGKVWSPSSLVPSTAAAMATVMRSAEQEKLRDSLRLDDLKIVTPKVMNFLNSIFSISVDIIYYGWKWFFSLLSSNCRNRRWPWRRNQNFPKLKVLISMHNQNVSYISHFYNCKFRNKSIHIMNTLIT